LKHGFDRQAMPTIDLIHPGHVERYKFAASRVKGYVLDIACGVGYGSWLMSPFADVVGVDIDEEAIEYANTHYAGPDYRVGNAVTRIEHAFDWIVSLETIEHLPSPGLVLDNFRPAENLIISTPNQEEFPFVPEDHKDSTYPHLRHYTPDQFETLLNDHGWTVVEKWGQKTKISPVTRGAGKFLVWVCK